MGTKYSGNSASGYNSSPPSDDGSATEANKVKWSTVKTKLGDPVKTLAEDIDTDLQAHFNVGPTALTSNTTLGASHFNTFIQASGSGVTLSLTSAATLGAGWFCWIRNTDSSNSVTIGRAEGTDTFNGSVSNYTLRPGDAILIYVNAAANGFFTANQAFGNALNVGGAWNFASSVNFASETDVASAGTTDIGAVASNNVRVTGTTTITSLGTANAGITRDVRFAAALTLTHNGTSLILPGAQNITTRANDVANFMSLGSGNWICRSYRRGDGTRFEMKSADIASAGTTDLSGATGNFVDVTGTTTITALGTAPAGETRHVRFTGALTLTHNATSLILPGAANITTANGDSATFISLGSGNWLCSRYTVAALSPTRVFATCTFAGTAVSGNVSAVDQTNNILTWSTNHNFTTGDLIYRTGGNWPDVGGVGFIGAAYVRSLSSTTFATYRTLADALADTNRDNQNSAGSNNGTAAKMPPADLRSSGLSSSPITNWGTVAVNSLAFTSMNLVFAANQSSANYGYFATLDAAGTVSNVNNSARAVGSITLSVSSSFGSGSILSFEIL